MALLDICPLALCLGALDLDTCRQVFCRMALVRKVSDLVDISFPDLDTCQPVFCQLQKYVLLDQ